MQPRMTVDNGFSFIVAYEMRRSHPVPTLHRLMRQEYFIKKKFFDSNNGYEIFLSF
jgi:hypothetical protein